VRAAACLIDYLKNVVRRAGCVLRRADRESKAKSKWFDSFDVTQDKFAHRRPCSVQAFRQAQGEQAHHR
jgi:hypothetical protein